jgi:hypothetical protein
VKTLIVINAWAGGQDTFDRNLPLWEKLGLPIVVACPTDSQVRTGHVQLAIGLASYAGPNSRTRWAFLLSFLAGLQYDGFVLVEYDSLSLCKTFDILPGLHGIVQPNLEGDKFLCDQFVNPPWTLDKASLVKMARVAGKFPQIDEGGWDDRLLAAWAQVAGVPILRYEEGGFSRGKIEPHDFPALTVAIARGYRWLHGVKSQEAFDAVMAAAKEVGL